MCELSTLVQFHARAYYYRMVSSAGNPRLRDLASATLLCAPPITLSMGHSAMIPATLRRKMTIPNGTRRQQTYREAANTTVVRRGFRMPLRATAFANPSPR